MINNEYLEETISRSNSLLRIGLIGILASTAFGVATLSTTTVAYALSGEGGSEGGGEGGGEGSGRER